MTDPSGAGLEGGAVGRASRRSAGTGLSSDSGSATAPTGDIGEPRSYYGRPILKSPVWKPEVP